MNNIIVAGSGIEPEPEGYEPSEIPLLYPAMPIINYYSGRRHRTRVLPFAQEESV
jgi:hypothetical protein